MVTSVSRILSASTASWVRIGVTVIAQIALVPLYLGSWEPLPMVPGSCSRRSGPPLASLISRITTTWASNVFASAQHSVQRSRASFSRRRRSLS